MTFPPTYKYVPGRGTGGLRRGRHGDGCESFTDFCHISWGSCRDAQFWIDTYHCFVCLKCDRVETVARSDGGSLLQTVGIHTFLSLSLYRNEPMIEGKHVCLLVGVCKLIYVVMFSRIHSEGGYRRKGPHIVQKDIGPPVNIVGFTGRLNCDICGRPLGNAFPIRSLT